MITAPIAEIFISIQGEGIRVGEKQIFVRFGRCNLNCSYCDTIPYLKYDLISWQEVKKQIMSYPNVKVVSLTGGEPLLEKEFLLQLLPELSSNGYKIYLETNGSLPEALKSIWPWIDFIAMDIKLPSVLSGKNLYDLHEKFLNLAIQKNIEIMIKIVVIDNQQLPEFLDAVSMVAKVDKSIPLVIQPEYNSWNNQKLFVLDYEKAAKKFLDNVYIIPQLHKILGVK